MRRAAWCFWHSQQPYKNLYREKAKKRPSRGLFRCCCLFLGLSFVICRFCCKKTDVRLHKRRFTAGRFATRRNILGIVRWPKEDMPHFFLSRDKWETCWVALYRLSRTLFPWTRRQWLQQLESSFAV